MDAPRETPNQPRINVEPVATRFFADEERDARVKEEFGGLPISSSGMTAAATRKASVISQKCASSSQLETMAAGGTADRVNDYCEARAGDDGLDTLRRWGSAEGRFAILDERFVMVCIGVGPHALHANL